LQKLVKKTEGILGVKRELTRLTMLVVARKMNCRLV
jgi:hypothetical protein